MACFFLQHFEHCILEVWGSGEESCSSKNDSISKKKIGKKQRLFLCKCPLHLFIYIKTHWIQILEGLSLCVSDPQWLRSYARLTEGIALIESWNVYLKQKCQTTPPQPFKHLANNKLILQQQCQSKRSNSGLYYKTKSNTTGKQTPSTT